eukprot:1159652-Pelagomonas_calceolata.AAC.10
MCYECNNLPCWRKSCVKELMASSLASRLKSLSPKSCTPIQLASSDASLGHDHTSTISCRYNACHVPAHAHAQVRGCLYNSTFHVIVTADEGGAVCVWNINNGQREGRFLRAHGDAKVSTTAAMPVENAKKGRRYVGFLPSKVVWKCLHKAECIEARWDCTGKCTTWHMSFCKG